MTTEALPQIISLLAHDIRWRLVKSLTESDYRVNELVGIVHQPLNLVSYHLKKLRDEQLVTARRSEADGRDTYYSLNLDTLRERYRAAGSALHPSLGGAPAADPPPDALATASVIFICTHNSARSQMAEGLMRTLSQGRITVSSGGSEPTTVHPDALLTMDALRIDIRSQASRHFSEFRDHTFDYVITVCDRAREVCPVFPGDGRQTRQLHWGFPDPVVIEDKSQRQQAFEATAFRLKSRIKHFLYDLDAGVKP